MVQKSEYSQDRLPANYRRPAYDYEDRCNQFRLQSKREFEIQYFPYYNARLKGSIESLKVNALVKWGADVKLCSLSQLGEHEPNSRVAVMGVLFKHMDKQPSILKEVSDDHQILFETQTDRYTSENDYLILQEGSEAIRLSGDLDVKNLVTGVVACVIGVENDENNSFVVEDICFAGPPKCAAERPLPFGEPKFVLLVSGLGFSRNEPAILRAAREMLMDYLIAINEDRKEKANHIVKLIVAGNSVGKNVRKEETKLLASSAPQWAQKSKAYSVAVVKLMDEWLSEVGKYVQVDVMPGETDPASMWLPQQAFHPAILPSCCSKNTIRFPTNPYAATFDGTLIMGTSGQNVNTIRAYSEMDDGVQIMCRLLEWNHQAPIAPDCLHCYPFTDKDPFIFQELPHVYFAGNQPTYNSMMTDIDGTNTRLISIPDFETTYNAVLLNLSDLTCEIASFA